MQMQGAIAILMLWFAIWALTRSVKFKLKVIRRHQDASDSPLTPSAKHKYKIRVKFRVQRPNQKGVPAEPAQQIPEKL